MAGARRGATKVAEESTGEPEKGAPQETPSPGLTLSVRRSEGIKRAERPKEDNPVLEAVRASLTEGALAYDVGSEKEAKQVASLLRRAAQTLGVGLSQSTTPRGDGTFTIDFKAAATKRARKYTVADIRKWFREVHNNELSGPISAQHRAEFKAAHDFK